MNWKKIGKRLLFPPPLWLWVLWPVALALLIDSALNPVTTEAVSIAAYALSFYALMLTVLRMPAMIGFVREFQHKNKYLVRYRSDIRLQMSLSLTVSSALNLLYALFQLGLGVWHRSVWFYAMAGYYLLLAMMRLLLLRSTGGQAPNQQPEAEWQKYRLCGICLLIMTLTLLTVMVYFVGNIRVFRHHEITTIAMATYTFAALALAIRNAIHYKRYGSPVYSAAKVLSLVSALVSLLTLENAMLTVFGQDSGETFRQLMLGTTGAAVVLIVQGMAIYMMIHAGRKLRSGSSFEE